MATTESQEQAAPSKRCPWCHETEDPLGKGWLVCPRDHTPAHAACVAEFGLCAICRTSLDLGKALKEPQFPRHVSKRAIEHGVFVRPRQGGRRFGLEPLPGSVEAMLSQIAREYKARPVNWSGLVWAGFQTVAFVAVALFLLALNPLIGILLSPVLLGAVVLAVAHAITNLRKRGRGLPAPPRAKHILAGREATASGLALAEEIASSDREAVSLARTFREAVAAADQAERALPPLERDLPEIYAEHLESFVPVQDARAVRGIGPETVAWLLGKGITTLRELVLASPVLLARLGERRRAALEAWALDRLDGIARLALSDDFPGKERLDRSISQDLERWHREGDEAAERAARSREALVALAAERPRLRALLDEASPLDPKLAGKLTEARPLRDRA